MLDRPKFDRKRKTLEPCARCRMHVKMCFCIDIPSLDLATRVSVLIHAKELKRTSNTGRLATLALTNSGLHIRGLKDHSLDASEILDDAFQPLLFFPSDDATELTHEFISTFKKPVQLIVPDGNWRQASKVHTRYPEFAHVPRVIISTPNESKYVLRKETTPEGMATLQAIATAMSVIESPEVGATLMKLYELKLKRTLIARGVKFE